MIYEYLIFNIIIISGPLFLFFWRRDNIIRPSIKPLVISIFWVFIFFVIWDQLVVNYFWFFNSKYILGLFLLNLPVEEVLFFITVPFSCLFLWVNYKKLFKEKNISNFSSYLMFFTFILAVLLLFYGKIYSSSVLLVFFAVIILDLFLKSHFFLKKSFIFFIFLITNGLTFIFNLYLTARPIVIYSELVKTNINIVTIPVEDFIFGMALVSLAVIIYEKNLLKRG
jgi:lycopene cyclase domain-containing protein